MFVDSDGTSVLQIEKWFLDICEDSIIVVILKETVYSRDNIFGAEFVTMKQGIGALRDLRYKLRMMDIPLSSPSYIYGDNMSVVHNISRPESLLRKKSNSVCNHTVCGRVPSWKYTWQRVCCRFDDKSPIWA